MRRFLKWLGGLLMLGAVAAAGLYAWFVLWPVHSIPALHVDEYVWAEQGWGKGNTTLREYYYYTAQGTSMPQGASWVQCATAGSSISRSRCRTNASPIRITCAAGASSWTRRPPRPILTSFPSASRAISIRASARTCSTSPARPATRARSTTPNLARRAPSASTAARPCTPSPT